jgi:nucleoside 2-deoxyribosyltransferase
VSLDSLYNNHIRPAILEAGYDEPVRVDREQYNDRIDDHIVVGLKQCKFTVADYTFQRSGVYYEAGFAHGQGKQVIMCCPKNEIDTLHFDTNHFNHIVYENGEELKTKLVDRILATIGPGKNYVPVA